MTLKRVAIIGASPTGIYTFSALLGGETPLAIAIYEEADEAGVGMPYSDELNSRLMLANIASIEIPPLTSTYLEWLRDQPAAFLARYGVEKAALHDRQFLPRILLGQYFRDQFLELVSQGKEKGHLIAVHETCRVTDLEARPDGVALWTDGKSSPALYDLAVIATGHVWPEDDEKPRAYFPSPWSGMLDAEIPACRVGIMGTSLSAIDAAMAVAAQHGDFVEEADEGLRFDLSDAESGLTITLMSRSGILPEADFYCPIPYEPLRVATKERIAAEIAAEPRRAPRPHLRARRGRDRGERPRLGGRRVACDARRRQLRRRLFRRSRDARSVPLGGL
ncbi:FAD/NAD(P)-binding protein [Sphingopyxis sp. PET50]|uniref:FAD/NAD(P)-binding protein n=1 Tax=Sphingopyxis sp. PET50 TaxID=2976533 RepID=UPI0021AF7780|nr:FAD/NAD(P)-binding protein [Sphingopyxis sp. PET50]